MHPDRQLQPIDRGATAVAPRNKIPLDPDVTSDRKHNGEENRMTSTYQAREFAKRAGVTVRALHYYDRLGLFKPSGRTGAGYHLYSDRDLVRLEQIVALKFIGFPLSTIRELLQRKNLDLAVTLREQRQIIAAKRDHLDRPFAPSNRPSKQWSAASIPIGSPSGKSSR